MRDIRFKGKDAAGKWVHGSLVSGTTDKGIKVCFIATGLPVGTSDFEFWDTRMSRVEPKSVSQYVGLNDMDGKEIYEGDVLMIEGIRTNRYSKVWWNPEKFTFYIGHSPLNAYLIDGDKLRDFRIVGNIYDNPELKEKLV